MFDNIGRKIMGLAKIICWIGIIASVFSGFLMIAVGVVEMEEILLIWGFIMVVAGPIASWISSFLLYGFGQLVENTRILVEYGKFSYDK